MGPLIIAALCRPSAFPSIAYLAERTHAGSPSTGVDGMGFSGSSLPDANTSYAWRITVIRFQQPNLNLPGDEIEGGDGSAPLHSLMEATSNFSVAGEADWPEAGSCTQSPTTQIAAAASKRCFMRCTPFS